MTKIKLFIASFVLVLTTSMGAIAQQTETAVLNPYSQYGLGSLSTLGTAATKGMGGAGIANRERFMMNLLNPASYNATDRQNVLFSASGSGTNNYLKSDGKTNSHNYFSLGHVGMQVRLSKKFGFGFVIAPYSDMGYEISKTVAQNDVITDIGNVRYDFTGSGGVAQFKAGFAGEIFKGFNLGINYVYYVGSFDKSSYSVFSNYVGTMPHMNIYESYSSEVSVSSFEVGAQYRTKVGELAWLNFGATFQPKATSNLETSEIIANGYSSSALSDYNIIKDEEYFEKYYIPMKMGFGVNYITSKLSVSLDYTFEGWDGSFPDNKDLTVSYQDRNVIRLGAQYIPNRFDIRSTLKRWSYRAGFSYGNSYVVKNGVKTNDIAASLGLGIPIEKDWFSEISVAAEFGQSGTLSSNLVRNNYIKLNIGITFAARRWFVRFKYY